MKKCMNPYCGNEGTLPMEVYGHHVGLCCEPCGRAARINVEDELEQVGWVDAPAPVGTPHEDDPGGGFAVYRLRT